MNLSARLLLRPNPMTMVCAVFLLHAALLAGCQTGAATTSKSTSKSTPAITTSRQPESAPLAAIPHVVTADIQAGIEHHIAEQTRRGGGYFELPFNDRTLRLKLVRVHTAYLANLGPRRHFACVDLVDTQGDVYDVDFFLAGDPGAMTVTETTVHKCNGKPYYVWRQKDDETWERVAVDDASRELLGVVEGADRFEFIYQVVLPQLDSAARMWIPLPETGKFQSVDVKEITAPGAQRILTDQRFGNKVLFLELGPQDSGSAVEIRAQIKRREKAVYRDRQSRPEEFLGLALPPNPPIPVDDSFQKLAAEALAGKTSDLVRARALYDQTIDHMRYMKYGPGAGQGDAGYAAQTGTGQCTEYHSYFIALARAAGIPARFAVGAAIPSERDAGAISSYHCWAEFYADGRWWPVDISEADKYSALSTYYFGHNPANRVELSRGRNLVVEPGPVSGPINFLAYPVLEVAGQPIPIKPRLAFRRLTDEVGSAAEQQNNKTAN